MKSLDTNKKEDMKKYRYKIVFIEDGINLDKLIRFTKEVFIKK
jgi:hypothetical protein